MSAATAAASVGDIGNGDDFPERALG